LIASQETQLGCIHGVNRLGITHTPLEETLLDLKLLCTRGGSGTLFLLYSSQQSRIEGDERGQKVGGDSQERCLERERERERERE
jgi:hypothetical protein